MASLASCACETSGERSELFGYFGICERVRKFGCVLGVTGERSELENVSGSGERSGKENLDLRHVMSGAS